jgi:hypothetical protein
MPKKQVVFVTHVMLDNTQMLWGNKRAQCVLLVQHPQKRQLKHLKTAPSVWLVDFVTLLVVRVMYVVLASIELNQLQGDKHLPVLIAMKVSTFFHRQHQKPNTMKKMIVSLVKLGKNGKMQAVLVILVALGSTKIRRVKLTAMIALGIHFFKIKLHLLPFMITQTIVWLVRQNSLRMGLEQQHVKVVHQGTRQLTMEMVYYVMLVIQESTNQNRDKMIAIFVQLDFHRRKKNKCFAFHATLVDISH